MSEDGSVLQNVNVKLENAHMWQQFHAESTEMIITKLGRRMFPSVQIKINGLDRRTYYYILMEIVPISKRRHKYIASGELIQYQSSEPGGSHRTGWTTAGIAEPQPSTDRRLYVHSDSPATGTSWMQQSVSFIKLKLTNNLTDHHNNVVLTSMHKYIPRIWIIQAPETINTSTNLFTQPSVSFAFAETVFIAVTAYQNENITKLKIDNNPFAKGFRVTGHSRSKKKFHGTACNRIDGDGDSDNVSCFDSKFHERNPEINAGRIMSNLNFDGISSPQLTSSLLKIKKKHHHRNDQVKFHRPWTDLPWSSSSAISNVNQRLHFPSYVKSESSNSIINCITNFTCFPTFFHPIRHRTFDASLTISRSQYYSPLNHQTIKIYPECANGYQRRICNLSQLLFA